MKGAVKDAVPSPLRAESTENVAISFFFFFFVKYIVSQLACTLVFIFRIVYIVFFATWNNIITLLCFFTPLFYLENVHLLIRNCAVKENQFNKRAVGPHQHSP